MARRSDIVDALRRKVIAGAFVPGESFPEESLAAEFRTSRTPVREALIILEAQSLVDNEANRGFRIASVSIDLIRSCFESARAVYPVMAALALDRATPGDIEALSAAAKAVDEKTGTDAVLAYYDFVILLAKCSRNPLFVASAVASESYHCFVRSGVLRSVSDQMADNAKRELALHIDNVRHSLAERDKLALAEAMTQLIEGSRVFLISHLV
jgi:DNA-binding GntR family transcriptional regulator